MAVMFASAVIPASAQDFYKGKTISIIVGFSPGGLYDLAARVLARHLGDHISGKPAVIVQTMTGAGGTSAVIYLYNNAVRHGTAIGMLPRDYPVALLPEWQRSALCRSRHFSASIRSCLRHQAFDPEQLEIRAAAFRDACITLGLAERADAVTEIVAGRINDLAQRGVATQSELCQRATRGFTSHATRARRWMRCR